MNNKDIIAKIKAEIERRVDILATVSVKQAKDGDSEMSTYYHGKAVSLEELISFLSTLESETTYDTQQYTPRPSVSIEDVARVQFASHAKVFDEKRKAVFNWEQFKEVAGIFYGFGKKDSSDTLETEKPMSLEEEISRTYHDGSVTDTSDLDHVSYENIASHFAEWGAEHLKK